MRPINRKVTLRIETRINRRGNGTLTWVTVPSRQFGNAVTVRQLAVDFQFPSLVKA